MSQSPQGGTRFCVLPGPLASARVLTRARRYEQVEAAVAAMGQGIVIEDGTGRLVAFHERHLGVVERIGGLCPTASIGPHA